MTMNQKDEELSQALLRFIGESPSCYHACANLRKKLEQAGYQALSEGADWKLEPGGRYFVTRNGSSLAAFRLPLGEPEGFQMAAAHCDSPVLKVKPRPELAVEGHYCKLNVECYGGMLYAPWLDRPLSVAGRLLVREGERLVTRLVNVDRDLLLIPNLAIHMNRRVNEGVAYNAQVDLLPLLGGDPEEKLLPLVAEAAGVQPEDICGSDLFLYPRTPGTIWGAKREFLSSRALDDLQCAFALSEGLLAAAENPSHIALCAIFDNEEVGSTTKQGADSTFLADVLEGIRESLGKTPRQLRAALSSSFLISADNAHAVHPNHPEKADPSSRPYLNGGIVLKHHAKQKYTTDGVSEALLREFCQRADVKLQSFANRSDLAGGSTLGNISNRHVSLNTVDIGLPQLAMHSCYETAGVRDTGDLVRLMQVYFASGVRQTEDGVYCMV